MNKLTVVASSDLPKLPDLNKLKKFNQEFGGAHPDRVIDKAVNVEIQRKNRQDKEYSDKELESIFRAICIDEFNIGFLLDQAVPNHAGAFGVYLSHQLQNQYQCTTPVKKSLAHLASLDYCRVFEIQRLINRFLNKVNVTDLEIKRFTVMSKELDRAQRHYLTTIQALEIGLQPAIKLSIRTQTANIASQQAIQQVGEQVNVKGQ
ncbi:MAG: hypothetical protein ACD_40C00331G0014 [uncultured bacterium]|nr:MAG: hypothetical protein ACD_40C00331G0014 [uncultured bacterium]